MSIFSSISGVGSQMLFTMNGVAATLINGAGDETEITIVPNSDETENASVEIGEEQTLTRTVIVKKADIANAIVRVYRISFDGVTSLIDRISDSKGGNCLVTLTRRIKVEASRPGYRGNR